MNTHPTLCKQVVWSLLLLGYSQSNTMFFFLQTNAKLAYDTFVYLGLITTNEIKLSEYTITDVQMCPLLNKMLNVYFWILSIWNQFKTLLSTIKLHNPETSEKRQRSIEHLLKIRHTEFHYSDTLKVRSALWNWEGHHVYLDKIRLLEFNIVYLAIFNIHT